MKLKITGAIVVLGGLALILVLRSPAPAEDAVVMADDASLAAVPAKGSGSLPELLVYKTESCGCCALWVEHIEAAGFEVAVEDVSNADLMAIKERHGVPFELTSCHTALAGSYVLEGHIPAKSIKAFLKAAPEVAGLAVPGMPLGSPGMEHPSPQPYDVIAFDGKGNRTVFEHIDPR